MKKNGKPILLIVVALLWAVIFFVNPDAFHRALKILISFLKEMGQVLPFVLILAALLTEWIPSETVKRHLGESSGFRGALFAYLLGSLSAGPIYAAFPVALALKKKGASVRNLTILISTWAVIKVPMLFMELKSLGFRFTVIRYSLTLPTILLLGILMDKLVPGDKMAGELKFERKELLLPGKNCGGCGFGSCEEFAQSVDGNEKVLREKCLFLC